ncbi:MAG TPA: type II toxin-antitoxin system RelE/ParE family toxin [Rhizomicrobium sp.]|nr:type II toxin-antitoxin system RelE/ParE family toxin [Rhizomicrobium sp.]
MRLFKVKWFAKFAKRERIQDASLKEAIARAAQGSVDADLGGHVIKQRVARPGQGKSGGYRVIVALRTKERAVFLYGFAKNEKDNIGDDELRTLKEIAAAWLEADEKKIRTALADGLLTEIV